MSKIPQLLSFLEASPNDAFLVHALALEYIKILDTDNALQLFKENIRLHPEYVATYYHLGKLYEQINAVSEAIEVYEKGMEMAEKQGDRHAYSELRSVHEELTF